MTVHKKNSFVNRTNFVQCIIDFSYVPEMSSVTTEIEKASNYHTMLAVPNRVNMLLAEADLVLYGHLEYHQKSELLTWCYTIYFRVVRLAR